MQSPEKRSPLRDAILLSLILLLGLVLRLLYLGEIVDDPTYTHPIYDPQYNHYWAEGLATGDWSLPEGVNDPEIRTTPHGRPPGYPWFLAAIYKLFGVGFMAPRLVQMLLGLLNTLLIYRLGRLLFSPSAGHLAALLMATYWAFIYFEGILTYPSVVITLLLLLMLTLRRWALSPSVFHALLIGILMGAFSLFRPNGLLFAPVIVLWMGWRFFRTPNAQQESGASPFPWKGWLLQSVILSLGIIAVLTPTFVRNYVVAKDVVFISSYGGLNFYVGTHPESTCVEPRIPELYAWSGVKNWCCFDYPRIVDGLAKSLDKEPLSFSEANSWFYKEAINNIANNPQIFLQNLFRKTLLFWGPREITNDTTPTWDKHYSPVLRHLPGFPLLFALFLCGLALLCWRPSWNPALSILLLFIPVYFLSVLPYFIAGRYRLPLLPFLVLIGAYALAKALQLLRARKIGLLLVSVLGYLLIFALVRVNYTGYEAPEETWHIRQAIAATSRGEWPYAEAAYRKALQLRPDYALIHSNLGRVLERQGKLDEAYAAYETALDCDPESDVAHNNLGHILEQEGRYDQALAHYRIATGHNPYFEVAWKNRANVAMEQALWPEAEEAWRKVLELSPKNAAVAFELAQCLQAQAKAAQAEEVYRKLLERLPNDAATHNALGYLLQTQGRFGEAQQAYEKAIELAPQFDLAYNNLGNVLLVQQQAQAALTAYRRATEIAPSKVFGWYNLGLAYEQLQQADQAMDSYRTAVKINPAYAQAWNNLGYLLAQAGKAEEAVQALRQAIQSDPKLLPALVNLGDILNALGENKEAAELYQRALKLSPGAALLEERLRTLRNQPI